jgi:hypothetical protein
MATSTTFLLRIASGLAYDRQEGGGFAMEEKGLEIEA